MKRIMYFLIYFSVFSLVYTGVSIAAPKKPTTVDELAIYKGIDRQQILEEGARKEGKLTFYTSNIESRSQVDAFQKKYPFIKVEVWQGGTQLVPRVLEEYKANSYIVDVIGHTQNGQIVMEEAGILHPFYSPNLVQIEEGAVKMIPGGGVIAAGHYLSGIGLGYNTKVMGKERPPKTYQDLLDPKWRDKIAIAASNTGVTWLGGILDTFGEEFVGKLVNQKISVHAVSGRALLDMIINGEYLFSPTIFDSHVNKSKDEGAPVEWIALEPVSVFLGQIMLAKKPLHPHAAMLFIDFDLSRQSGDLYKANGYDSPRKDIPNERVYKKHYGPRSSKQVGQWNNVFNKLFLQK